MSFSSIFEEKVFWIPDKVLYNPVDQTDCWECYPYKESRQNVDIKN